MWVKAFIGCVLTLMIATSGAFANTTWVVDPVLLNNKGPTKTVVWAGTKAHQINGTQWDKNNNPLPISNDSGAFVQTNTPNAESTFSHAGFSDKASAYASAQCTGPISSKCSTGNLISTSTVILKQDTASAASWARAGLTLTLPKADLRGIANTNFPGRITLYSNDDPVQSLWGVAITDLGPNELNEELYKLLKFTEIENKSFKTKNGEVFVWKKPDNTYFQMIIELDHKGNPSVKSSGSAEFQPLTEADFVVEPCLCKGDKKAQVDNPEGQTIKGCHELHLKHDILQEIKIKFPPKDNQESNYYSDYSLAIDEVVGEEASTNK